MREATSSCVRSAVGPVRLTTKETHHAQADSLRNRRRVRLCAQHGPSDSTQRRLRADRERRVGVRRLEQERAVRSRAEPHRHDAPDADQGRLDLQEGPGDQYGARFAADQGNSAVERPLSSRCVAPPPRA